ncbi:hypothetical protein BJY04DRAFT_164411 [Aspergillus karnatakaensis]|uniref:dienelactone hydrolase n=1 Tax=Aspergillus karnatakaensis TaxID=1810916 RepID=UPI003CCD88A4
MARVTINAPGGGFLYSNSRNARLIISAETDDFDSEFVQQWQKEGLNVIYVPYTTDEKEYARRLMAVKEGLGVGDNYGVIAFGDAASFCLEYYLKPNNVSRLCAMVSYYPTAIPDTRSRYPPGVRWLTHLAGDEVDVISRPQLLGIQGKQKRTTRRIDPGTGTGELLDIGHRAYTYYDADPGFAEVDLDEYNKLAADLAFSRTLEVLRRGYGRDTDLEKPWEDHLQGKFFSMDINATLENYTEILTPTVTFTPTLSGGTGARALRRFYDQHFLNKLPPSMHLRLLSRTVGADRVVDELFVSFDHTHEIPWLLPGVPPTNKKVEIVLVSIVSLRAGKLYSEHVYWDQASVLVQIGLLDPKLVPKDSGVNGVDRLPVLGKESARRILNEDPEVDEPEYHNRLIMRARKRKEGRRGSQVTTAVQSEAEGPGPATPKKGKKTGVERNGGSKVNGIHEEQEEDDVNGEAEKAEEEKKEKEQKEKEQKEQQQKEQQQKEQQQKEHSRRNSSRRKRSRRNKRRRKKSRSQRRRLKRRMRCQKKRRATRSKMKMKMRTPTQTGKNSTTPTTEVPKNRMAPRKRRKRRRIARRRRRIRTRKRDLPSKDALPVT